MWKEHVEDNILPERTDRDGEMLGDSTAPRGITLDSAEEEFCDMMTEKETKFCSLSDI
jgi:hypothetical protein